MAKINIDDSLIPEGYEATGEYRIPNRIGDERYEPHLHAGQVCDDEPYGGPYIILRRKPVLIRVVLDVTGPKRRIDPGEYFLNSYGEVCLRPFATNPTDAEYIPLSAPVQVTK